MKNLIKNELIKLKAKNKLLISFLVIAILFGLISAGVSYSFSKMLKEDKGIANWKTDLKEQISVLENSNKSGNEETILKYKYMLENNVAPDGLKHQISYSTLEMLFSTSFLFMIIIIAIITSDIISGEYTPPTMKVLLSRPISRGKILLSKFFAAFISSAVILISVELICYLVLSFIFGFPNPNTPVAMGTKYKMETAFGQNMMTSVKGSTYFISLWLYLIFVFIMQLIFIATCVCIFLMISTLFKSGTTSMTLCIVGSIALSIIIAIPRLKAAAPFIFLTYSNPFTFASLGKSYESSLISTPFIIFMLILWSAVSYAIAHFVFTKKDILI